VSTTNPSSHAREMALLSWAHRRLAKLAEYLDQITADAHRVGPAAERQVARQLIEAGRELERSA